MNIGILYGEGVDENSEEAVVAAEVYDADQTVFVETINKESLLEAKENAGCHIETLLIVTNDDLDDMGVLRNLFTDVQQLDFVQSVKKLRKSYGYMFSL